MKPTIRSLIIFIFLLAPLSAAAFDEECPLTCETDDSGGWEVDFTCENPGQPISKNYRQNNIYRFDAGQPVSQRGGVDYTFMESGNTYEISFQLSECDEAHSGYCLGLVATGGKLGKGTATCMNFD
jgi:hypothetical protein